MTDTPKPETPLSANRDAAPLSPAPFDLDGHLAAIRRHAGEAATREATATASFEGSADYHCDVIREEFARLGGVHA